MKKRTKFPELCLLITDRAAFGSGLRDRGLFRRSAGFRLL